MSTQRVFHSTISRLTFVLLGSIFVRYLSGSSLLPTLYTQNCALTVHRVLSDSPPWTNRILPDGRTAKIGKVTMMFGESIPIYESALALQVEHNTRHAYPMAVLQEPMLDGYWSKPSYLLGLLLQELTKPKSERLEWLYWFDADIVLMNPKIPLEIFLPPELEWSHINLLVTNDRRRYLNNGVFFLRVCDWSVWLMSSVLSFSVHDPDVELPTADQSAMQILISEPRFANSTIHVPQRWFNAFTSKRGNYISDPRQPRGNDDMNGIREGDLQVHFAGHSRSRHELMANWVSTAEQHMDKWEVDLERTTYAAEIKAFWSRRCLRPDEEADRSKEWMQMAFRAERGMVARVMEAQHL